MTSLGPVQWIAARFPADAAYEGRVLTEIDRINSSGVMQVIDILFVRKNPETQELEKIDQQDARLRGLHTSQREIGELGEELAPGEAAAIMLIEHGWARDFDAALRSTGGAAIGQGFLPGEAVAELEAELAAGGG